MTFAVNLWLIRNGAATAYGAYVFWLSVAWVLGVVQGTLVLAHLSRLPSAKTQMHLRRDPERFMLTLSMALITITTVAVAIGDRILYYRGSDLSTPAAVMFIPCFLLFQFARTFAFSRQRPALAAILTGTVLVVAALALGIDFELGHKPETGRVLLITGLAYGGTSALVVLHLLGGMRPMLRIADLRRQSRVIHGSGWLMLGAGSNEVTSRLYSFVIVGRFGALELAMLSAVQVVIRPAWMLSSAWASIGFPEMAARRAQGDTAGLLRTLLLGTIMTASGSFVWSVIVIAGWPWISSVLYHGRYSEIGPLGYLWGANVVLGCLCGTLNTALLAVGEFRRLALIDMAGAIATVSAIMLVVSTFSYPYTIAATLFGQAMQMVLMALLLSYRLRGRQTVTA